MAEAVAEQLLSSAKSLVGHVSSSRVSHTFGGGGDSSKGSNPRRTLAHGLNPSNPHRGRLQKLGTILAVLFVGLTPVIYSTYNRDNLIKITGGAQYSDGVGNGNVFTASEHWLNWRTRKLISGVVDTVGLAAGVVQVEPPALVAMKAKVDAIVSLVNAGTRLKSSLPPEQDEAIIEHQAHLFATYNHTWNIPGCKHRADINLYRKWLASNACVQTGWVLLPIAWQCLTFVRPQQAKDAQSLKRVLSLMKKDSDRTYRHFTVMVESNVEQALYVAKWNKFGDLAAEVFGTPKHLSPVAETAAKAKALATTAANDAYNDLNQVHGRNKHVPLIFGTRMMHMYWASRNLTPPVENVIPIPITRPGDPPPSESKSKRFPSVFWRGGCHGDVRSRKTLYRLLHEDTSYNFSGVFPCDQMSSSAIRFRSELTKYVWSLAPREAFADPFILVEAIECGALPIFVADWKDRSESAIDRLQNGFEYDKILQGRGHMHEVVRELPPSELLEGLPFADVLDWSTFADAIDYSNIGMLGARLVTKSPSTMQLYLKAAQPLFKEDGILGYIMHRLGAQENLI